MALNNNFNIPKGGLTVGGTLSSSGVHYDGTGNSTQWNTAYTNSKTTNNITTNIAAGGIASGSTINAGTTLQQFITNLLVTTYYPTFTGPSVSVSTNLNTYVEAGTPGITLTVTLNQGSIDGKLVSGVWQSGTRQNYRSGAATGYTINGTNNGLVNTLSPTVTIADGANTFNGSVTYANGPQPTDSAGNNYSTPLAGSTASSSATVYGVRLLFYGTTTTAVTDSTSVRGLANSSLGPSNGTTFTITIPINAAYVVFAYPATLRDVTSVIYVEGLNADVKGAFTKATFNVNGYNNTYTAASYKVFTYKPAAPFSSTATYNVTI